MGKGTTAGSGGNSVAPEMLLATLERAASARLEARERAGVGTAIIKAAVDDYGLDRIALALEPARQEAALRAVVEYASKLGVLAQGDL